jgi:hypothetical protein
MSTGAGTSEAKRLLYPTYLDVPMLIDFVASLDDGVSFSSEVAEKIDRGRKGTGEANGTVGLPSIASLLGLNLSASGKLSRERTEQETAESKFVRQHTAASLFNRFHSALSLDAGLVEISAAPALASVSAGDLISCKGVVLRNPLEALLSLYRDIRPVMVVIQRQQARQGGASEEQATATVETSLRDTDEIFAAVAEDVVKSKIVDLPMRLSDGTNVILSANREFFTAEVESMLLGGSFRAIGKVTAVSSDPGGSFSLVRRGVMGLVAREQLQPAFAPISQLVGQSGPSAALPEIELQGPFVQVLPLAIYI